LIPTCNILAFCIIHLSLIIYFLWYLAGNTLISIVSTKLLKNLPCVLLSVINFSRHDSIFSLFKSACLHRLMIFSTITIYLIEYLIFFMILKFSLLSNFLNQIFHFINLYFHLFIFFLQFFIIFFINTVFFR